MLIKIKVIDLLGENAVIDCRRARKYLRLKKARKYNNGGPDCEHCPYRKRCNQSPKAPNIQP